MHIIPATALIDTAPHRAPHTHMTCNYDCVCSLNATYNANDNNNNNNNHVRIRGYACAQPRPLTTRTLQPPSLNRHLDLWKIALNTSKHTFPWHAVRKTLNLVELLLHGVCCSYNVVCGFVCVCVRAFIFLFLLLGIAWCWRYNLRLNRKSVCLINELVRCASKHHTWIHSYR